MLTKKLYEQATGRSQKSNVIAYQIRQSFRPGEITAEEANQVGYELASRFLKGKHAFIVATHTDREHIHNHIIFNSTALDGTRKFRDFFFFGLAPAAWPHAGEQDLRHVVVVGGEQAVVAPHSRAERILVGA